MLLIIDLSANTETFPLAALKQVDEALASMGFRKEVQSVVKPGRRFSVTYEGPTIEKSHVEEVLRPLAQDSDFSFSVELEESVRFP